MLIKIDNTVAEYLKNKPNLDKNSKEIIAIDNLARSHREGKHFIIASRNTLEYLITLECLEYNSSKVINYLYHNFSTIGAIEYQITDYIIVKSDNCPFKRKLVEDKLIFEMPLLHFYNPETLDKTRIVCEDLKDYNFFQGITNKYLKENKLNINIDSLPINGGGNNSFESYDYYLSYKSIVLSIVDSDKQYPESNLGQTYKNLNNTFLAHISSKITDLMVLSVREKENLIPPSVYKLFINSSQNEALEKLIMLEQSPKHAEKLNYFDFKDGLPKNKINTYFKELFEVEELVSCTLEDLESMRDDDVLISGLGSNPTKGFVEKLINGGLEQELLTKKSLVLDEEILLPIISELEKNIELSHKLFEMFPKELYEETSRVCKKIIAWSICFPKQSTI